MRKHIRCAGKHHFPPRMFTVLLSVLLLVEVFSPSQVFVMAESISPDGTEGATEEPADTAGEETQGAAEDTRDTEDAARAAAPEEDADGTGDDATAEGALQKKKSEDGLSLSAGIALLYCSNTGEVVYEKNANQKAAPGSLNRLMSAFLSLQKLSLDDRVAVSAEAAARGGSTAGLSAGAELTAEDMLYALLLTSDPVAGYALGEAVSGSATDFVALMNETAGHIGCKSTKFTDLNGENADVHKQMTTARDLLRMAKPAFSNANFLSIAGKEKQKISVSVPKDFTLRSSNEVLIKGGKGYRASVDASGAGGAACVSFYRDNGLELIIITMNGAADKRMADAETLVSYAKKSVKGSIVTKAGTVIGKVRVGHGAKTRINAILPEDALAYLPREASKDLIRTQQQIKTDLKAPLKKGDKVGVYRVLVGDETVNELDLIAEESVAPGWFPSYIGISNRAVLSICGVLGLLLALFLLRLINRARMARCRRLRHKAKVRALALEQLQRERERDARRAMIDRYRKR